MHQIFVSINHKQNPREIITENNLFIKKMITFMRSIQNYPTFNSQKEDHMFYDVLKSNNLLPRYHAKHTIGDGNCFYRSVSYLLFSSENNYDIVKLCCIFIIIEYESFFKDIIKQNGYDFEYTTLIKNICRKNEWADEVTFIATSIMLNRTILSFTCDENTKKHLLLNFSFEDNNAKPILIGYFKQHFVPILLETKKDEKVFNALPQISVLYGKMLDIVKYF